jgi:hypothetical protein
VKTRIVPVLITLLCAAMATVQSTRATTITVTNTNDSGAGSLRQALADANNGDTINFSVTTPATITLTSGVLVVNRNVTISGPTAGHVSVNGNAASSVFFIASGTVVTISNLTITNGNGSVSNQDNGLSGGGIYNYHATLTINDSTVANCVASDRGGGIYNDHATLTINNSTISNNSATGYTYSGYYDGGGIFNESGAVMIDNSTISGNSAPYVGGIQSSSFYSYQTAALTIANSTLSDNSGLGIYDDPYSAGLTIGNTILKASGIFSYSWDVAPTSLGYNMSDDGGGGILTGPGDQINTDPLLGPLQDNGGPTFTHALLARSPAIDAGDPSFSPPPDYDQRGTGFDRVVNGRIDIGAFEVQPNSPPPCTAQIQPPINADGSSVFTVRRGVVPVKFTLTCDGSPTCDLPPGTIAVTRPAGGTEGAINESIYSMSADTGSNFRIDGCQYIYNLSSSALGFGTYRVDILINSQVTGSATFQLN